MHIPTHIDHFEREAADMAAAAELHGPDAEIPTCPGWTMRNLVIHTGAVHRYAFDNLTHNRNDWPESSLEEFAGEHPTNQDLVGWFRSGANELVNALRTTPEDHQTFAFLPAPSPLAFWARRQAHETAIHRVDAQSASGEVSPIASDLAADGIDEMLTGFAVRPSKNRPDARICSLLVSPTDSDQKWLVTMGPDGVTTMRNPVDVSNAQATVIGTASDLNLVVWNRTQFATIAIAGDSTVLDQWTKTVRIR